jgi:hypothetical protein
VVRLPRRNVDHVDVEDAVSLRDRPNWIRHVQGWARRITRRIDI